MRHTIFSIGNHIYIVGGESDDDLLKTSYKYDTVTETLSMIKDPTVYGYSYFRDSAGFVLGGKIYLICGIFNDRSICYNPSDDSWSKISSPNITRAEHVGFSINGKGYIVGGHKHDNGRGENIATTEEFDPVTGVWSTKSSIPVPPRCAAVAVINDKAYVSGGYDSHQNTEYSSVYCFDPTTNAWVLETNMPYTMHDHVSFGSESKLIVAGGYGNYDYFNKVCSYDLTTKTWTIRGWLDTLANSAVCEVSGNTWLYGGRNRGSNAVNIMSKYVYVPKDLSFVKKKFYKHINKKPELNVALIDSTYVPQPGEGADFIKKINMIEVIEDDNVDTSDCILAARISYS